MIKCGECRYNRRDWTNPNNPDYYCGNEDSENYGWATLYTDGCEDGEEKVMAQELNINLKPCPFCGVKPTIRWEAWKEISPSSGCYVLDANHTDDCFILHMNGTNTTGRISSFNTKCIVDWWNRRAECDE